MNKITGTKHKIKFSKVTGTIYSAKEMKKFIKANFISKEELKEEIQKIKTLKRIMPGNYDAEIVHVDDLLSLISNQ